jgi:acyl-CoA thioesterase
MNDRATVETDAQALAERVRDAMFAKDAAAHALGMKVTGIGPGHATVTMTVRADMLNGFGICQGGLVTTLADMAFAYACNSFNELTVASGFDVDLLAASHEGDVLTAVGRVVSQGSRMGLYDIEVHNQAGERVAVFRGRAYRIKGKPVVA